MKVPDWPERLAAALEAGTRVPFAWGTHDCVCWSCEVAATLCGIDPAAAIRGTYQDADGARRVLAALGGETLLDVCRAFGVRHGFPEVAPRAAQRGDLVCCRLPELPWPEALGVCGGPVVWFPHRRGLASRPLRCGVLAWRL